MKPYDAVFSATAHIPTLGADTSTNGALVPPSMYCLYFSDGAVTYDRYAWDLQAGKPWLLDKPLDTGTLTALIYNNVNIFKPDNPNGLEKRSLDAALCLGDPGAVYLFQGGNCCTVSITPPNQWKEHTANQASSIAHVFGYDFGEGKVFPFPAGVDAALYSPADNKIWFFSGNQCESFDGDTYRPDHWNGQDWGSYNPAISTTWTGISSDFYNGISWAATEILVTDPESPNGTEQDSGCIAANNDAHTWSYVTPSNPEASHASHGSALYTGAGRQTIRLPNGGGKIAVELWGGGGNGGGIGLNGAPGGNGGAGAYVSGHLTQNTDSVDVYIGGPGEYTCYPADSPTAIAGGGGGGGGGGGSYINVSDYVGGDGGGGNGADGKGVIDDTQLGGGGGHADGTDGPGGAANSPFDPGQAGQHGQGGNGSEYTAGGGSRGGGGGKGADINGGAGAGGGGGQGSGMYGGGGGGGGHASGGGGGGQGPSLCPSQGVVQQHAANDSRVPFNQPAPGIGEGGKSGNNPGSPGAFRVSW